MKKIINTERHRTSTAEHNSPLAATQSDRARLIYSAAFRRLQQKAQVFSLESNSAVRSRLTHSVEVSHIGRYIVAAIFEKLSSAKNISQEQKDYWKENSLTLSNIVETACLMHDIGNPPFGHFGEAAIAKWASSSEAKASLCNALSVDIKEYDDFSPLKDFEYFDGNPQGFRIITKLQGDDGFYGLNLTYTQLAAFLKYTYSPRTKPENADVPFSKKIGFFDTERDIIESAWSSLKMTKNSRHPLGFLMEASDDISYCISDIEDGIEKGIISVEHFRTEILNGLEEVSKKHEESNICSDLMKRLKPEEGAAIGMFLSFKTKLSNFLVDSVAQRFVDNYNEFVSLNVQKEIICKGTLEYDLLKILKVYTGDYLFTSHEAECMELSGFSIISGILEEYQKLLSLSKTEFTHLLVNDFNKIKDNDLHIHRRLFNRLPKKHLKAYEAAILGSSIPAVEKLLTEGGTTFEEHFEKKISEFDSKIEWNLRAHLIVDFVSGMTDQFSMEFYQMLKGINVK
ncbi:dGTPase [Vibrio parahaemolyticus]|uniref:dGTPase n=1 Tax=Vibrio parahaemolyticus TaxID=670 RepID=UPI00111E2575|nr:dGTPase [Vibrio parahaemolyticus]EKN4583333.1 dGTPase [Vibrio parahaemolyticus]TOM04048.1 dGTPase [Vibrio parahaemolyticus]HCE2681294.1 dGTPase [Vibrio parahaemolyticus]